MFYVNKTVTDIAYKDVFDEAKHRLGIKTVYTVTDKTKVPLYWEGETGRIDGQTIIDHVPDYKERTYYLSGPHSLVTSFEEILGKMGISKKDIIKDYFPGYV
jgi:ferredoxin-NADP reductase